MPEENVEAIERLYSLVRFDRAKPESLQVAIDEFCGMLDPAAEWQPDENDMDPDLLRGEAEIRDFFERHAEPWEEFRWEPERVLDAGDEVVATARGRGSGLEVRAPYAHRFTFRAGALVRGQEYLTRPAQALVDAGLSE